MQLFNRVRPRSLAEVAGHEREKATIQRIPIAGRAWWITGKSGIGKTTLTCIMAGEVADFLNVLEVDASGLTPATLEDIEKSSRSLAIGHKPGRAIIINEAHGLRKDTVRQLLTTLERIPGHVTWIFTTTVDGMLSFDGIDAAPLLSRCLQLHLKPDREAFARRAMKVAQYAELDGGATLDEFIALSEFCDDNLRMMISQIETGVMLSAVTA